MYERVIPWSHCLTLPTNPGLIRDEPESECRLRNLSPASRKLLDVSVLAMGELQGAKFCPQALSPPSQFPAGLSSALPESCGKTILFPEPLGPDLVGTVSLLLAKIKCSQVFFYNGIKAPRINWCCLKDSNAFRDRKGEKQHL